MLTVSSNMTFTPRKCIHVLKMSVAYRKKYIIGDITWILAKLKDKILDILYFEIMLLSSFLGLSLSWTLWLYRYLFLFFSMITGKAASGFKKILYCLLLYLSISVRDTIAF